MFVREADARAGEQLGRVGIVGHHADVVGSELEIYGLLGPCLGIAGSGEACAHGQTQLERVGEADPLFQIRIEHHVEVGDGLRARIGFVCGLERFQRMVQFLDEGAVDGLLRVVGQAARHFAEGGVGQRTVDVGHTVHGLHLDHLSQREDHRCGIDLLAQDVPRTHHVVVGLLVGFVLPFGRGKGVAGRVAAAVPVLRLPEISGIAVAQQVVGQLVGVGALGEDVTLHGLDERRPCVVAVHVFGGGFVFAGVDIVEVARTRSQARCQECECRNSASDRIA